MSVSLEEHYAKLEARFQLRASPDYERLVVPQGNADESVHRWFHMKEAYSPYLLSRILKDLSIDTSSGLSLHDPFMGSGTTLVSALLAEGAPSVTVSGSEINPFLYLLSSVKASVLSLDATARAGVGELLLSESENVMKAAVASGRYAPRPELAAFSNPDYFDQGHLAELLRMRDAWTGLSSGIVADLIGVCLAGCLEPCSRLRRDGRALRYVATKQPESPRAEFARRVALVQEDLCSISPQGHAVVAFASAMDSKSWPSAGSGVDVVCFSPPYPNNIDYTEVYKLEAWFLKLIDSQSAFKLQRQATMQSHPSIIFPARSECELSDKLKREVISVGRPLLEAVPSDRYMNQRSRMIKGYLVDVATVMSHSYSVLKPGGYAVYVVGNSRHGTGSAQFTIASDVVIATLAETVGFDVQEVKVARSLHRRGKHEHLRESVVMLRKVA